MQAMIYDPHPISHSPFGTLMLGDCLQLLQQLPPESVDMVHKEFHVGQVYKQFSAPDVGKALILDDRTKFSRQACSLPT